MKDSNPFSLRVDDLCEIFRIYEPDTPHYFRILDVSDRWVLAESKADDGEDYGIALVELESICRIRFGSRLVQKLFSNKESVPNLRAPSGKLELSNLEEIETQYGCITVYCEENDKEQCFIGKALRVKEGVLFLMEYRPIDSDDQTCLALFLVDITRIEAGGDYEARLLEFYEKKREYTSTVEAVEKVWLR